MRIIAGEFKSRIIEFPKLKSVKPTQDRVREAIFNVIAPHIQGACVLDLYAGSGAYGIEAISRGAEHVTFVDNNITCLRTIKHNLDALGISSRAEVIKKDVLKVLDAPSGLKRVDIIFLDPPYYKELAKKTLIKLDHYDILSQYHNIIIAEHHKKDEMPESLDNITLLKQKRFGDTILSFYRKK